MVRNGGVGYAAKKKQAVMASTLGPLQAEKQWHGTAHPSQKDSEYRAPGLIQPELGQACFGIY